MRDAPSSITTIRGGWHPGYMAWFFHARKHLPGKGAYYWERLYDTRRFTRRQAYMHFLLDAADHFDAVELAHHQLGVL